MDKKQFLNLMARGKMAKRYGVDLKDVCPICFGLLKPEYENNGFAAPDPTHYEVVGVKCSLCGYQE